MTRITQLPLATTISETGVFVIVDDGITKKLTWQTLRSGALKGDTGASGPTGPTGPAGPTGPRGNTGTAASVAVGTVSIVSGNPTVTNVGDIYSAVLNFGLPQGPKGDTGTQGVVGPTGPQGNTGTQGVAGPTGAQGAQGSSSTIRVGTVTTGSLAVTNTGTINNPVFNFVIPAGPTGATGATGSTGTQGAVGPQGSTGTQGAAGPTGPKGDTGTYVLVTATTTVLGGVKIDGTSITIDGSGVISSTGGGGGSGLTSRTTTSTTTSLLTATSALLTNIVGYTGYALLSIQTSAAAWVTVYSTSAAQYSDISRSIATDPTPNSGIIAEAITTGSSTTYFTPAVVGYSGEVSPSTNIPVKIYNNGVASTTITVTLTLIKLEA